jgi:ubiquinone/menaquinone biosynthesis C-methylase UbiE
VKVKNDDMTNHQEPDHPEIYRSQAENYEALVSREDYQNHILPALQKRINLAGLDVVEFGAGTGRLTCQIAPLVNSIQAFDQSAHMLDVARHKLEHSALHNWSTDTADHRKIPTPDHCADLILSGWSVCYIVVDHPDTWRDELQKVFAEMNRILKPSGSIVIIETLGTGFETPHAPDHLVEYYAFLESEGFARDWIRTDYRFEDMQTARSLAGFFFGDEMLPKIVEDGRGITLPECTGFWFKKI